MIIKHPYNSEAKTYCTSNELTVIASFLFSVSVLYLKFLIRKRFILTDEVYGIGSVRR